MVTLNAHFDGRTIVPDEPLSLPRNQKLRITIEPIDAPADASLQAWSHYRALARRLNETSKPDAESLTDSVSRMRR
jgi:hypothetical protein